MDSSSVATEGAKCPSRLHVPELDVSVITTGSKQFAIRAEGYRGDSIFVPVEGLEVPASGRIPEFDGTVPTAGSQQFPVGTEGDCFDTIRKGVAF